MAASTAQVDNLVNLLDGYATKGGHHLNVNVLNRETLLDKLIYISICLPNSIHHILGMIVISYFQDFSFIV